MLIGMREDLVARHDAAIDFIQDDGEGDQGRQRQRTHQAQHGTGSCEA